MAEMGGISGEARGRVISGQMIEALLSQIPEQVWAFDVTVQEYTDPGTYGTADLAVEVPMKQRREIIAEVLALAGQLD